MDSSTGPLSFPTPLRLPQQPNIDNIKRRLLKKGIQPTPKIIHTLRKKELQKSNRRLAKLASKQPPPLTDAQKQEIAEESQFQIIKSEYRKFTKNLKLDGNRKMVGRPWEGLQRLQLRELASQSTEYSGEKLNPECLEELSDVIECEKDKFSWLLDDDIEFEDGWFPENGGKWAPRKRNEVEAIKFLVERLSGTELSIKDWKFTRMMRQSGLQFTEVQMLKIVEALGKRGQWKNATSVVEWLYNSKEFRHFKSKFVYTKLLAVLGRAGKAGEALRTFNIMRGDANIYPDIAAYHSLAVTLGQSGLLKELINVIEYMKEKPKKIKNVRHKSWDPVLQPDIVVFNAVINACVSSRQWNGVSWVFEQLRKYSLKPNGASYGLAMEVMLQSEKYDLVHEFFGKMKRSGEALNGLTFKVLVKAFWKEGKVDEAVQAVRDMERRGIVGVASVYYELARCLCFHGRWKEAILEIEKLKMLPETRPLAVTFSGMILSSLNGGYINDCISIFEHCKIHLAPDIGVTNVMLKAYGRNDMFDRAKELFEETKKYSSASEINVNGHVSSPKPDAFTFGAMLEASASALQWEYFDCVYKEMTLSGHQLDLKKHSSLLVEASRAGKSYLLEHAFDSKLESGEIPPLSFFSEMVCFFISQHNYERAISIINAMAHAPFQISFQQWINLFEINEDRIDRATRNEMLEILVSRDLVKEATVLNLLRVLEYKSGSVENSINPLTSNNSRISKNSSDCCDDKSCVHESPSGIFSVNSIGPNMCEDDDIHKGDQIYFSMNNKVMCTDLENACSVKQVEKFEYDMETYVSASDFDDREYEQFENREVPSDADGFNFELILPTSKCDDSHTDNTPSADDILKSWKKMKEEKF